MTLFSDWLLWGGLANLLLFRFHSTWTPLTSTCSSWLQSGRANNSERYEQYVAGLTAFSFFLECLPNHVQCFSKSVGNPFLKLSRIAWGVRKRLFCVTLVLTRAASIKTPVWLKTPDSQRFPLCIFSWLKLLILYTSEAWIDNFEVFVKIHDETKF